MKELPSAFTERMKKILGEEYETFEKAMHEPCVKAYRVNTDKISLEDFEKINIFGRKKIPYVETGYYLEYDKVGNHPYHHAGMIYVQDPGAMATAECVEIQPDWHILDMCAAPGGKSTQLKNKLGENGVLVSNEIIASRCKILTGNVERLGLKNTVTTCMDTKKLAKTFPKTFDLVMVDAPCSGEGMFRKDDIAIDEWSEDNVKMCAQRQSGILENAAVCVKNGGYIVYATCTYSLEENEMTVDEFL
ncbi:MAG: RsmB/NOP family class I SAM-dependent RNA methyltransferase, partial [Clostridia bacterium]|nr:RsmB/NOP family class I SAM-dependent RNA methyltransferase [Clostridia bacterium]